MMSTSETGFWPPSEPEQPKADASDRPESPSQGSRTSESTPREATPAKDSAAAATPQVVRPADTGSEKSKSQRVREYLAEHPDARNRDAVEALSSHGVTAADVSNVKMQIRKKAEKQKSAKARVQSTAAPRSASEHAPRRPAAPAPASSATKSTPPASEVAMGEIEAGLTFVEKVGGIERARQIVDLIARIREVNLA